MKLATYKDGSRDGQLVVVSRDLSQAHYATGIAGRLQQALDDWNFIAPQLQDLYHALNQGKARHAFPFDPARCMAPLPRTGQWADGSAYLNHVDIVRRSRGAPVPEDLATVPCLYQLPGDGFLGACEDIVVELEDLGVDFEAEVVAITGDVARGASPEQALEGVRLLMLANDVTLRELVPVETVKGYGFCQAKPATAFSPVAVTPDELGEAWSDGRVHLTLGVAWNGRKVGMNEAGTDMAFHFGQLIAHLCGTRAVQAGTLVGSGSVSNMPIEGKGGRLEWPRGYSCIAEKRAMEILQDGAAKTGYMKFGDTVKIEMKGRDGESVFGAIEQKVVPPHPAPEPAPEPAPQD